MRDNASFQSPPVALTMGDPAGIGPDITLLSWAKRQEYSLPPFFLIADPELCRQHSKSLNLDIPIKEIESPEQTINIFDQSLPVLPIELKTNIEPGQANTNSAEAILKSIRLAVSLTQQTKSKAVVTNPINKNVLYQAGFSHPGHTEFLGELSKELYDIKHCKPVMMLASQNLRVVPTTIHIPLKDVFQTLSEDLIIETVQNTAQGLQLYFQCKTPRIAITGLNPHAGEEGQLGSEENNIIRPALHALSQQGYHVTGPHPADVIFHEEARKNYDAVVAMYHDQALIPVKTIGFDEGVNVTLGLPFIRTSPDHGTAYDIAGTGRANPRSLVEAIKLAYKMAINANQQAKA